MIIRSKLQAYHSPVILRSINRGRYKSTQVTSPNTRGSNAQRKLSPKIKKSFFCYKEIPSPNLRSTSVQKYKSISAEITPTIRHNSTSFKNRTTELSMKYSSGQQMPDNEEIKEIKKKELVQTYLIQGLSYMRNSDFLSSILSFSTALKEDHKNSDCLYHRACCYMKLNDFKLAIPDFLQICSESPMYKKKMYVALAMCFANLNDLDSAVRQVTKGLLKFQRYTIGYITRGQFYLQLKRWEKAIQDFCKAVSLNPSDSASYIGLGDAYLGLSDKKSAIKSYTQAIQSDSSCSLAYLKRGKLFFELQSFIKSLSDLDASLSLSPEDPEACYYKSMILLSQAKLNEAALFLEQVIKFDTSAKKYTGAAIYDLGAIKIKQKDYYGAIHTFKRATDLNVELKEQKVLKGYVEAILMLMKRKFKEGISQLSRIIKKKEKAIQEYIGNCYAFRGYAYASIEKHEQAVKNLVNASKIQELDNASRYNLQISSAWVIAEKATAESLKLLEDASKDFPKNIEPLSYQAAVYLSQARKGVKKTGEKSKSLLEKAIELRDTDSDLYFFKGIVLYFLEKPVEAVPEFEIAIDKSEDNVPIHFLARGLCYAQLRLLKEAVQDFSICIQLNDQMAEAYFYRGRCFFLLEDLQQAFMDYQKMIANKNDDPVSHIHAGNILMISGSIEDASKAYTNAISIFPTAEGFLQRAKCNLILGKVELLLNDLESALKLGCEVESDIDLIKIMIDPSETLQKKVSQVSKLLEKKISEKILKAKYFHWYRGALLFMMDDYQKAKIDFKSALDIKYESDEESTDKDNSEILYNLALCYIFCEQHEAAVIHLQELVYILEGIDRGKILILISILTSALQEPEKCKKIMQEAAKFDPETSRTYESQTSDLELFPFSSASILSKSYPKKELKIPGSHSLYIRPSFGLPFVEMPKLDFKTEDFILDQFQIKHVKCKPEAPWLNRVGGSIQFTEEIREINCESFASTPKVDSEDERSIFDSSFQEMKVFHSVQVFGKKKVAEETAELLNFVKVKERNSRVLFDS